MKRGFLVVIFLLVAGGAGIFFNRRSADRSARAAWASAIPPLPPLDGRPKALTHRIRDADTRARGRPAQIVDLREVTELYLANGFVPQAEHGLRALMVYDPREPRWPHFLAGLLAGYGRGEEAILLWKKVLELKPEYLPARLKMAEAYRKTNRLDEAILDYRRALKTDPKNSYALYGLAQIEVERGAWGTARDRLEEAIAADPTFSSAYSLLATVADRLGDLDTAIRARERAGALGRFREMPDEWSDALVEKCFDVYRLQVVAATIAVTRGGENAVPLLRRAIALAPDDARPHRQLGKIYFGMRKYREAREELERALALQPTDEKAYLDLVNVFRGMNSTGEAIELLKRAVKECPQSDGLQMEMALALVAEKRFEEAIPFIEKAGEISPDNLSAEVELSTVYFRLGRNDQALGAIQTGLQRNPNFAPLLLMMARYCLQSEDPKSAEANFDRARGAGASSEELDEFAERFRERFGRAVK